MKNLRILAGKKALSVLRDGGFSKALVSVVAGAAGGPKWLVLNGLDRAIFSHWLTDSNHPVFLVGSSIGAWRFAAVAQGMGSGAYGRFEQAYLEQRYGERPTAFEVARVIRGVRDAYLGPEGARAVLAHPFFRLSMLATRCRGLFARDERYALGPAMVFAFLVNFVSRRAMSFLFSQTLVHDPRDAPPFFPGGANHVQRVHLTGENMGSALMASGSIPLLMEGEKRVEGALPGTYRDGGILDYHLDIPFGSEGIVLFPHFMRRIIPGWLDKRLPWRTPDPSNMENVVLLCPSEDFVERLPLGKIPDRGDFALYRNNDRERVANWKKAVEMSFVLGEEFLEAVEGGSIGRAAAPLEEGRT
jgi:hypothetical protein